VSEKSRSIFDGLKNFKQENSDALLIVALIGKPSTINNQTQNEQQNIKSAHENNGLPLIKQIFKKQFIPRHFIRKEKAKEAEDVIESKLLIRFQKIISETI